MQENEVLVLNHVSKEYKTGEINYGTLARDLQSWWAKVRGKEDPNKKLITARHAVDGSFAAVEDVCLTVIRGETLGIIGRNGAGKSTLLKLLSRITAPTSGEIQIRGRLASMLEVGTGFHPELTGRENIYLNGSILGMRKTEIDKKVDEIIAFSECEEFIDTPVKRYSSGMLVKLAFSVAAHLEGEILIMDEVLAVGDLAFQKKSLNRMLETVHAEGRTVLCVSHNMETIRSLCKRCIVMEEGKKIFDGDTEEAIALYAELCSKK